MRTTHRKYKMYMTMLIAIMSIVVTVGAAPIEVPVIERAVIKAINESSQQVMIHPAGTVDEISNYIVLNVSPKSTKIESQNDSFEDLEQGMVVYVEHSPIMTKSLPPQTQAFLIRVIEEEPLPTLENIVIPNMTIISIDQENGIMEVGEAVPEEPLKVQYRVFIGEYTKVSHCRDPKAYTYKDLKEGMVVTIVQNPIVMPSEPPTITALEVIITKD